MNSLIQEIAKSIVPYRLWVRLRQARLDAARRRRVGISPPKSQTDFSCAAAIDFLETLGCPRDQVIAGSMPQSSLEYAAGFFPETARCGLHVGNFVGVSLGFFVRWVKDRAPDGSVVALDPNLPHRGIENPLAKVLALLTHFGLGEHCLPVTGFSLERNAANDGQDYAGGFVAGDAASAVPSCAQALPQLARLMPGGFDFAVMDGNHDGAYLRRELAHIAKLLRPGGVLILDDVSSAWFEIERVFDEADASLFEKLGADGRVGVLRLRPAESAAEGPGVRRASPL